MKLTKTYVVMLILSGVYSLPASAQIPQVATAFGGFRLSYSAVDTITVAGRGPLVVVDSNNSVSVAGGLAAVNANGVTSASFDVTQPNADYGGSPEVYTTAAVGATCNGSSASHLNPALGVSSVYYLYYAPVTLAPFTCTQSAPCETPYPYVLVASTVPPTGGGSPPQQIAFWFLGSNKSPVCQTVDYYRAGADAAFVGSFLTDPSGHLVPFVRLGNEVMLSYPNGGVQNPPKVGGPVQVVQQIGHPGIEPPNGLQFTIPGALIPATANAIIVDINAQNFTKTAYKYTFAAGGAGQVFNSFNTAASFFIPPGPGYAAAYHVLISPSALGEILGIINGPRFTGPILNTTFSYQGYVEDVRSPALAGQ